MAPLTNPVEQAIEEARRRGELNNLSGSGKPMTSSNKQNDAATMHSSGRMSPEQLMKCVVRYETMN